MDVKLWVCVACLFSACGFGWAGAAAGSADSSTVALLPGDCNDDCKINILDLLYVRNRLGADVTLSENTRADVNGDGKINIIDLIYVRNRLNSAQSPASGPYHYSFELPCSATGYVLAAKEYLDDLDPASPPAEQSINAQLATFAAPGEYEPLTFVIYAQAPLSQVQVIISQLNGPGDFIPSENITVRSVVRCPQRRLYNAPADDYQIVSRFLPLFEPFDLQPKQFREIWLTIKMPDTLPQPGTYRGTVTVAPANAPASQLDVAVDLLPIDLQDPPRRYGFPFSLHWKLSMEEGKLFESEEDARWVRAALQDMRDHGNTLISPGLVVQWSTWIKDPHAVVTRIRKGLELLRSYGFAGPIPILTGYDNLCERLGYPNFVEDGAQGIDDLELFDVLARDAIEELTVLQQDFPDIEFLLVHMDEVFDRGRLPAYIKLTQAAQAVPNSFRFYITINTALEWYPNVDEMRAQIDPYVDVRNHHGYTFEWWLSHNHTFEEYQGELDASGDNAWLYHNARGTHNRPEWYRIINGWYMWRSPFIAHLCYTYSKPKDDPFNDLDGNSGDYGFAFLADDGETIVPTRLWEAWREGIDDMRYLHTLETLLAARPGDDQSPEVEAARQWLAELHTRIDALKPGPDTQIKGGCAEEAPYINAIAEAYTGADYQQIRRTTAEHIMNLAPR